MKERIATIALSTFGVIAIAMSIITILPNSVLANISTISVLCHGGPPVSCSGPTCSGTDFVGCQCSNGTSASCPG